jgi:hypothetical protein
MQQHPIAHRQFSCRLRTLTASASSGVGVSVVSSVLRARTVDFLALNRPLLRPAFSRLGPTVESRRLRLLNVPRSEQSQERPVSLGCAPEGAIILRPFALWSPRKCRGVTQGRENTISLFSSAGASSLGTAAACSTPSSAVLQPPWPNPAVEGTVDFPHFS